MSGKFEFDADSVLAIEPGEKEKVVWDEGLPGFGVRVLPTGTRSWVVSLKGKTASGKARRRRVTIGRLGETNIEAARDRARELLAAAEEAVGGQTEPAAGEAAAVSEEEERKPAGSGSVGGDAEGVADVWIDPDEEAGQVDDDSLERVDPETGEVLPARSAASDGDWVEEGVSLEGLGRPVDVGPGIGSEDEDEGPDGEVVDEVLGGVLVGIEGEEEGAEPGDEAPGEEPELGVGSVEVAPDAAEEAEGEGSVDVESAEAEVKEGKVARAAKGRGGDLARKFGGLLANLGARALRIGRRARRSAEDVKEDVAQAGAGVAGPAMDRGEEVAVETASGEELPAWLAKRRRMTVETEGRMRAGNDVSEATAAALARNLDEVRGQIDRATEQNERLAPQLEEVVKALRVFSKDFRSWRRRWIWPALALVLLVPVLLGAGVAIQSRMGLLPQEDPSLGWRGHIWEHYGAEFMDCFERADKEASGRTRCEFEVRAR